MRLGSCIAWRAFLLALIAGCLAGTANCSRDAAVSNPLAALEGLSARRVAYVRHMAANSIAAGELGRARDGAGANSWSSGAPRRLLAGSGRPRRQLPEQDPPGSVQLLSMLLNDKDASLADPEGYWQLPPAPPGGDRAPSSGIDESQQGDTAAQVGLAGLRLGNTMGSFTARMRTGSGLRCVLALEGFCPPAAQRARAAAAAPTVWVWRPPGSRFMPPPPARPPATPPPGGQPNRQPPGGHGARRRVGAPARLPAHGHAAAGGGEPHGAPHLRVPGRPHHRHPGAHLRTDHVLGGVQLHTVLQVWAPPLQRRRAPAAAERCPAPLPCGCRSAGAPQLAAWTVRGRVGPGGACLRPQSWPMQPDRRRPAGACAILAAGRRGLTATRDVPLQHCGGRLPGRAQVRGAGQQRRVWGPVPGSHQVADVHLPVRGGGCCKGPAGRWRWLLPDGRACGP